MKFAVCDGDALSRKKLAGQLRDYCLCRRIGYSQTDEFSRADEMISGVGEYDFLFLDIGSVENRLKEIESRIRKANMTRRIFFVFSDRDCKGCFQDLMNAALSLGSFCSFEKPFSKTDLFYWLDLAIGEYCKRTHKVLINTKEASYTVSSDDIIMVSSHRDVKIYTSDRIFEPVCSFDKVVSVLQDTFFYKSHRCYLINMHYVSEFNKDTIYLCGREYEAFLTQRKRVDFMRRYNLFLQY